MKKRGHVHVMHIYALEAEPPEYWYIVPHVFKELRLVGEIICITYTCSYQCVNLNRLSGY